MIVGVIILIFIKGAEGKEGCQLTAMPADLSDIALAKSEALAKVGCRLTAEKPAKFGSFVYSF